MTEADRHARNAARLLELYPTFRVRVSGVISDLESAGYRPRIQDGWRPADEQLIAYNSGHSRLRFGFHNVTSPSGTPEALAVDLIDDDYPLASGTAYLLQLARFALIHELNTGIRWGLPTALREAVDRAILSATWGAPVKLGWDPTHLEATGLTARDAGYGRRPS